jgi:hypothetical protein
MLKDWHLVVYKDGALRFGRLSPLVDDDHRIRRIYISRAKAILSLA